MLLTLGVTLYTSRVVFNALGIEDFGIYNVVAGVVTMFSFIKGAMSSANQRFFSFELGRGDLKKLHNTFNMSINIHIVISIIVVLVCETIGVWFLNNKLTISPERLDAANFVFHCAVAGLVLTIMDVPYNANIVAHERMQAFAYISLLDVGLKLAVVSMLSFDLGDNLEVYALLTLISNILVWFCYYIYNRINFSNTKFNMYWNASLFKELMSYTGWNVVGNLSFVFANQGINILLNIFFGPMVNASRAVSYQIQSAVNSFIVNIQMSIKPQIIKNYAIHDLKSMHLLIIKGTKFSFFLLYLMSLPILLKTSSVLDLWLGNVPEYAVTFTRLAIVDAMINCWSGGLITAAQATGKIKKYQLIVGGILLFNIPISYVILNLGVEPFYVVFVSITLSIIALVIRLVLLKNMVSLPIFLFFKNVILPSFLVLLSSFLLAVFIDFDIDNVFLDLMVSAICTSVLVLISVLIFGVEAEEREFLLKKLNKLLN